MRAKFLRHPKQQSLIDLLFCGEIEIEYSTLQQIIRIKSVLHDCKLGPAISLHVLHVSSEGHTCVNVAQKKMTFVGSYCTHQKVLFLFENNM